MFRAQRDPLPLALGATAVAILLTTMIMRPQPLPPGSAHFRVALQVAPAAVPVQGYSYAIDTLSSGRAATSPQAPLRVVAGSIVHIAGWAVDPRSHRPVTKVLVQVDHRAPLATADCHENRPDVAAALSDPGAAASGFEANVATSALSAGTHTLSFAEVTGDGRRFTLPTRATIDIVRR